MISNTFTGCPTKHESWERHFVFFFIIAREGYIYETLLVLLCELITSQFLWENRIYSKSKLNLYELNFNPYLKYILIWPTPAYTFLKGNTTYEGWLLQIVS